MYGGTSTLYLLLVFIRRYFIAGQGVYWFLLVLAEALFVAAVLIKYNLEKLFEYPHSAGDDQNKK